MDWLARMLEYWNMRSVRARRALTVTERGQHHVGRDDQPRGGERRVDLGHARAGLHADPRTGGVAAIDRDSAHLAHVDEKVVGRYQRAERVARAADADLLRLRAGEA